MDDTPEDLAIAEALAAHGVSCCPHCGRVLDLGDVSWNDAESGSGTPMTWAQIICQRCDTEVAHWSSWWPGGQDGDVTDFVVNVLPDWKNS